MNAPKLPSFMKINRNKRFDFTPRYYDPQAERIEALKRKYQTEAADRGAVFEKERMRVELRSKWEQSRSKHATGSPLRLVVIAGLLFGLAYLLIFR